MTQDREATLLTLIKNLFVNRDDITVARWETDDKSGYSPLCSNKKTAACRIGTKPKSPCRDCPNRAHVPLSDETLAAHLAGNMTIAVSAPAPDGSTKWGCIDVDGEQSLAAAPRLLSAADELDLQLVIERSRSGQGLHGWFFFAKVPASTARAVGIFLIKTAQLQRDDGFDFVSPRQSTLRGAGLGSFIALPLNGREMVAQGKTAFIDPETLEVLGDQLDALQQVEPMTAEETDNFIARHGLGQQIQELEEGPHGGTAWPEDLKVPEELPEELKKLVESDKKLGKLWNGKGKSENGDTSKSGYDFSVAFRAAKLGIRDAAALATLIALRPDSGAKGKGSDYLKRTVEKALEFKEKASVTPGLEAMCAIPHEGVYCMATGGQDDLVPCSNFTAQIEERLTPADGTNGARLRGKIRLAGGREHEFACDAGILYDNREFAQLLASVTGGTAIYDDKMLKRIRNAVIFYSTPKDVTLFTSGGPTKAVGYLSRDFHIVGGEVIPNDGIRLELPDEDGVRHLGLSKLDDDKLLEAGRAIVDGFLQMLALHIMTPLLGHVGIAPFVAEPEIAAEYPAYRLELIGPSGGGKTNAARAVQNFFGDFSSDGDLLSFGSTAMAIEAIGNSYAGCVMVVDDLKRSVLGHAEPQWLRVFQNAADGHGRCRLRSDGSSVVQGRPLRGLLLITGEQGLDGEASVTARGFVIRADNSQKDEHAKAITDQGLRLFRGYTTDYIAFVQRRYGTAGVLAKLRSVTADYLKTAKRSDNRERVAKNLALNHVGFELVVEHLVSISVLTDDSARELLECHQYALGKYLQSTQSVVRDEEPAELFFSTLRALIAARRAYVGPEHETDDDREHRRIEYPHAVVVAYRHQGAIAVVPETAYEVVTGHWRSTAGNPFPMSKQGLAAELNGKKLFVRTNAGRNTLAVRVGREAKPVRAWLVPSWTLDNDGVAQEQEDAHGG